MTVNQENGKYDRQTRKQETKSFKRDWEGDSG